MSSLNKTWQLLPLLLADLWKEEVAVFVAGKHVVHQHRRPRPVLAQPHLVGSLGADGAGDHHSLHQLGTLSQHRQRTQEPARGNEETRQLRGRGWKECRGTERRRLRGGRWSADQSHRQRWCPGDGGTKIRGRNEWKVRRMRVDSGSVRQERLKTLFRLPHNYH